MKYEIGYGIYSDVIRHLASSRSSIDDRLLHVCKVLLPELQDAYLTDSASFNLDLIKHKLQYPDDFEEFICNQEDLRILEQIAAELFDFYTRFVEECFAST